MNDVVERVIGDVLLFTIADKSAQFSWQIKDKRAITAPELDDVIIDADQKDLIIITNQSEDWSIIRTRKSDAPAIKDVVSATIRDGKIEDIGDVMSYRYQGSFDYIVAWCVATKLKLA